MASSSVAAESPEVAKSSRARIVKEKEVQANDAVNQYFTAITMNDESMKHLARVELHLAVLEYFYAIRPMGQDFDTWDQTAVWVESTFEKEVAERRCGDEDEIDEEVVLLTDPEDDDEDRKVEYTYPVRGLDYVTELAEKTVTIEETTGGTFSPSKTVKREVTQYMDPERSIEIISILDEIKTELGLNPTTESPTDRTDLSVMEEGRP